MRSVIIFSIQFRPLPTTMGLFRRIKEGSCFEKIIKAIAFLNAPDWFKEWRMP